ncbi:RnfABCDGE type electron transport complex subunit G [Puteibacter caeruleilacunae]|nr:RnfABCDGE type electron transport complex subunit G [Puteibacter caeruleilacunae]
MAKLESNLRNMLLALFTVTFVAAGSLGLVESLTRGAILESQKKAKEKAIVAVLPEHDELGKSYKLMPVDGKDSLEIYPAMKAGKVVAVAIKTYTNKGFSGDIEIMTGMTTAGDITGYEVLKHKETPGLGTKMITWFKNKDKKSQNVIGLNPGKINLTVSKDGGDVDAITAATISSRAFLDAIQRAYNTYKSSADAVSSATVKKKAKAKGGKR